METRRRIVMRLFQTMAVLYGKMYKFKAELLRHHQHENAAEEYVEDDTKEVEDDKKEVENEEDVADQEDNRSRSLPENWPFLDEEVSGTLYLYILKAIPQFQQKNIMYGLSAFFFKVNDN